MAGPDVTLAAFLLFGAIAVVLSAVGVYRVLASVAGQRTREIGLRIAVGASPADVVWMFLGESAVLVLVGVGVGPAGAPRRKRRSE